MFYRQGERDQEPYSQQQIDHLLVMLREDQHQAKDGGNPEKAKFEVLTAPKKFVPCTKVLRQWHDDQQERCQRCKESTQEDRYLRQIRQCFEMQSDREGNVIQ
jgi:hypothetical protein